jgi:hypothetical protein
LTGVQSEVEGGSGVRLSRRLDNCNCVMQGDTYSNSDRGGGGEGLDGVECRGGNRRSRADLGVGDGDDLPTNISAE